MILGEESMAQTISIGKQDFLYLLCLTPDKRSRKPLEESLSTDREIQDISSI